ncbi:hypothetical protein [Tepidibacter mesophilus]|uniref:hypothetical protein n=1 Tax=Tepidibacter mesophilus TaxID=655607 RepID=UPI000C074A06|nr:hypothetical protein [Tepidibacter mesophilus]
MKKIISIVCLIFVLASYIYIYNKKENLSPYLLVTFVDTQLNNHYYKYNIKSKENDLLNKRPMTDYPTSIQTKNKKFLYYTSRENSKYTQLYELNLKTNKSRKLTSDFASVDYLRVDEKSEKIYMRVSLRGNHRNFTVATYDTKTDKIDIFNPEEEDLSIKSFDVNNSTGEVLAVVFSSKQDYENVDKANKNQTPLEVAPQVAPHYLKLINLSTNKSKTLCTLNKDVLDVSIYSNGNKALFTANDNHDLISYGQRKIYLLDIKTQRYNPIIKDSSNYMDISSPNFSIDGNGFYYIATNFNCEPISDTTGITIYPKVILYYDFSTKDSKEVWFKTNGNIRNFVVLR